MFASNDSAAYDYLPQSVGEFPQGEELSQKMLDAGLKEVRYYTLTLGVATLYIGVK
jgi:demethylmenaquinone methyltransferase/2-methoxy-6-polyprenyl-1,4-benzoquinol methylase